MLLTTVAALLAAHWATYRQLKQARAERQAALDEAKTRRDEVRKYRGEMGYLDVADPRKIYARALRNAAPDHWSWRVYLPKNGRFWLCTRTMGVPKKGIPHADSESLIETHEAREELIDASVEKGPDGKWRLNYRGSSETIAPLESSESEGVTAERQETVEPGQPLVLLRMRKLKTTQTYRGFHTGPIAEPTDGVMIWIKDERPVPVVPPVPPATTPSPPAAAGGE
jgi:hypothetical protein